LVASDFIDVRSAISIDILVIFSTLFFLERFNSV
jgi:hypothetical protein